METGTPAPTKNGPVRLEDLDRSPLFQQFQEEQQQKVDKAKQDNNYWEILSDPTDRVLADKNQDGNIEYAEYREYVLSTSKNGELVNKDHYQMNYTVLFGVGMVCITAVIVAWILRKPKTTKNSSISP